VSGETWFDHEWATNQLTPEQVGWDWFSLQLDDGTELMLYAMRTHSGGLDPNSSGTFIAADGTSRHLRREDFTLRPLASWKSKRTGGEYPIAWELSVPSLALTARITTPVENQELVLTPIAYWEGLIDLRGTRGGREVKGHGYLELTGYAGALVGLSEGAPQLK
jgi:predicted secreted hydrolase